MQVWITSFIIFFALSQLLEWLRNLEFSLPMLAVAGLLLSIISNYDKRACLPFWPSATVAAAVLPGSQSTPPAAIACSSAQAVQSSQSITENQGIAPS